MKYIPSLAVCRTVGPPRKRVRLEDDPLYLFGALLRITEKRELERKYGPKRKGNLIRVTRVSHGEPVD